MNHCVKPYRGTEPYLFVTYSPENPELAHILINRMAEDGYHICYTDENTDLDEAIAHCAACIAVVTAEFVASQRGRIELMTAIDHGKPVISLLDEGVTLPLSLRFQIGETQKIQMAQFETIRALCEQIYSEPAVANCMRCVSVPDDDMLAEQERLRAEAARLAEEERRRAEAARQAEEKKWQESHSQPRNENATYYAEELPDETDAPVDQLNQQAGESDPADENATYYAEELPETNNGNDAEEQEMPVVIAPKQTPFAILLHPAGGVYYPLREELTKMGRSQDMCRLFVPKNKMMSRHHADIAQYKNKYYICDMESVNGTFVDGTRLEPRMPVELHNYSEILLANEQFIFVDADSAEQIINGALVPMLRCEAKDDQRGIGPDGLQLGRSYKWFSGTLDDPRISRSHAEIISVGEACYIRDLESTNGTFLNDRRLTAGEEYRLNPGDRIQLGDTELKFMQLILRSAD